MKTPYFQIGDICKHFKGQNLIEKNIYEIIAVNVTYTGEIDDPSLQNLVVYKSIFQQGKTFVRNEIELLEELSFEKQNLYHQKYRVEKVTEEELMEIQTEEFKQKKISYLKQKYEK